MTLAEMFMELVRQEKRLLPGLRLTDAERRRDADLYRRLKKLDDGKRQA